MTSGKIIRKVAHETPSYKSYESKKININYEDSESRNSFSGQFKIKHDEGIILTIKKLTMPLGRGYITTDSVFLINYYEKYYIQENIGTMSEIFGIDLDYHLLQALLTADVSKLLQNDDFDKDLTSIIEDHLYRIDSQLNSRIDRAISKGNDKKLSRFMERMDDAEFINYTVWVDPQYFVIRKLTFNNIKFKESLTINYDEFELVGRSLFPQKISLGYNSPKQNMAVEIKLSKPEVNKVEDFNFSIPEKYEKHQVTKK